MGSSSGNVLIDLGSGIAPVATLLAVKAFRHMQMGQTLVIRNCNAETRQMILRCFPESSYELLEEQSVPTEKPEIYQVLIRKTGPL